MSGKTTNLHYIHGKAPAKAVGDMVNIDTESERTLHFDLLPLELGKVKGYTCRFEFYTVPGQSYYAATRRMVIEGADGIVFVTDSRREAMDENIESMNDLYEHLRHHQLPDDLPIIIQYNKQDLANAIPPEQLNPLLNHRGHDHFSASALTGGGVMETMKRITTLVIQRIKDMEHLEQAKSTPAPHSPPPPAAQPVTSQSWLLTCHHCETVLEVPHAEKGSIFTCGSCQTPLEVVDPEHGITKLPQIKPAKETNPTTDLSLQGGPIGVNSPMTMTPLGQPPIPSQDESKFGTTTLANSPPPRGVYTQASSSHHTPLTNTPLSNTPISGGIGALPQAGEAHAVLQGFTTISPLDGNLLGNRYRIQDIATGTYYRAFLIRETVTRLPGFQQQLESSAQICFSLHQSNILKTDSVRQGPNGLVVLSPDAPDYEPLTHLLSRRKTLKAPQVMEILRQLCLALEEAARHSLTHGWIRPDAVLINSHGNILLDDLALPKQPHYLVRESMGESAATTYHLAPEHIRPDDPTDIRTDIFLLGALLFQCLTGSGLVTGFNAHEALHKITSKGTQKLRDTHPEVSRALNDFVAQLTEVERKDRFQTYRELLDRLDKFGGGAQRQSINGTRSINRGSSSSNATVKRSVTQRNNIGNTSHIRRPTYHDTVSQQRPAKKKSSTGTILIILLLLTLAALGGGYLYLEQQRNRQQINNAPVEPSPTPAIREEATEDSRGPKPASSEKNSLICAATVSRKRADALFKGVTNKHFAVTCRDQLNPQSTYH